MRAADDSDFISRRLAELAAERHSVFVCFCEHLVPSGTRPNPDCPIPAHRQLARELMLAAEGIAIGGEDDR